MTMPHLLVIEDDAQIRRMFARTLGHRFVVSCAPDVETAISMIAGEVFDVILCDLNLPRISGREFYALVKHRPDDLAARMVILTGAQPAEDDAFAAMLGERYLLKTCSSSELIATLLKVAAPRVPAPLAAA